MANITSSRAGVLVHNDDRVKSQGFLRGTGDLRRALDRLQRGMQDEVLKEAILAPAKILELEWRTLVLSQIGIGPGTAHYADAIEAKARKGKKGATAVVGIKLNVPLSDGESHPREYASRFEFGSAGLAGDRHRARAAVPTLRPAFDSNVGEMFGVLSDELRRLIDRATSGNPVSAGVAAVTGGRGRDSRGRFV